MATSGSGVRLESNHLRRMIEDMIQNIELVMSNIHVTLGDIGVLVKQIDNITERLETKYEHKKIQKPEMLLDANRNQCELIDTPGVSSNSNKATLPSPYLDYTYLELTNDCDVCIGNLNSFTYNEKYPLWIQYDTWRTGNTISDISEVSAGSDSSNGAQSGSDGCSKSVKSHMNGGDSSKRHRSSATSNKNSNKNSDGLIKLCKCCKTGSSTDVSKYCGVYEEMMEQQLEDIDLVWQDGGGYEVNDSFSDDYHVDDDVSRCLSNSSISISDEHVIQFNKIRNSWTAYKPSTVTVREFSDSSSDVTE